MTFCTLTCDRGDRPQLLDFCREQIDRFTIKPDKSYFITDKPQTERFDLVHRMKKGIELAKADGIDWVVVIESDDYYPANYIEQFKPFFHDQDFIGEESTVYYNIRNRTYKQLQHRYRSSLFTTAFRISALNLFDWQRLDPHTPFLDLKFWEYAKYKRKKFIRTGAIGIKHAIGMTGGKGHRMTGIADPDLEVLRESVDERAFQFYESLSNQLAVYQTI